MSQLEDIAELKAENAALRSRLAAVESRLPSPPAPPPPGGRPYSERLPTVTNAAPTSPFEKPTRDEEQRLLDIVLAADDWLSRQVEGYYAKSYAGALERDFSGAFLGLGYIRRTDGPDTKRYFSAHIEDVNEVLKQLGVSPVSGVAVLAAIIAHGDIKWRKPEDGQLLEVGLNRWIGRDCSNRWLDVLRGAPLLAPTPRPGRLQADRAPKPVIRVLDAATGEMREIGNPLTTDFRDEPVRRGNALHSSSPRAGSGPSASDNAHAPETDEVVKDAATRNGRIRAAGQTK